MAFANFTANLKLNMTQFATNLSKAEEKMNSFAKSMRGKIYSGWEEPAKKSAMQFKDVARIVQGILVSRVFYDSLRAIRNARIAVWEFSKELEYANIAYTKLFGSAGLAQEFINVLKDFAAETPFSFEQSQEAARRLISYGVQYRNVMYMMQGILAASSMSGDPQTIERVSRAMGQIYTKGRLMNEEMRQLAEAGIPAYQILKEELNLTDEQLRKLGKTAIPASVAINALVQGLTKRYGDVTKLAVTTMEGIISNLKDNAMILAQGIFEPLYNRIKSFVARVGETIKGLREAFDRGGIGAVFEKIVPPEFRDAIRQLIANFIALFKAIANLRFALLNLLGPVLNAIMNVLNLLLPIITYVINVLAGVLNAITSNSQAMQILTGVLIGAAMAWLLFRAAALAATVIGGIVKVIGAVVRALSVLATAIVSHPILTIIILLAAGLIGVSAASNKASEAFNKFFNNLTKINGVDKDKILMPETKERASDLEKFNQALDGTADGMDNLADSTGKAAKAAKSLLSFDEVFNLKDMDERSGGGKLDLGLDIPDLGDLGAGLGEINLDDLMPDDSMFDNFGLDFVNNLLSSFWEAFDSIIIGAGAGGLLGAIIGAIFGGPAGAKVGGIIGALLGGAIGAFWDDIWNFIAGDSWWANFWKDVGAKMGGWFTEAFIRVKYFFTNLLPFYISYAWKEVVKFFTGIWEAVSGFFVDLWNSVSTWVVNTWNSIVTWFSNTISAIGTFFSNIWKAVSGFFVDIWNAVSSWVSQALKDIGQFFIDVWNSITGFFSDIWMAVSTWFTGAINDIGNFFSNLWIDISTWFTDTIGDIGEWLGGLWDDISGWFTNLIDDIGGWISDIWDDISGWFSNTVKGIGDWLRTTWSNVSTWFNNLINSIWGWITNIWNNISTWFSNTFKGIGTWLGNIWKSISDWFNDLIDDVAGWFKGIWKGISDWFSDLWDDIRGWISDIGRKINNWWNDLWGNKSANVKVNASTSGGSLKVGGHAAGGIFNKEHIARFAEGNKAEAIIPLEDRTAMQPFVNAIADGIIAGLAPLLVNNNNNVDPEQMRPLLVGTLIADDRSLRELERRMRIVQLQESVRSGR